MRLAGEWGTHTHNVINLHVAADHFMYLCNFQASNFGFGHPVAIISFSVPNPDFPILEKKTLPCINDTCNISTIKGRVYILMYPRTSHNPLLIVPKFSVLNPVIVALQ